MQQSVMNRSATRAKIWLTAATMMILISGAFAQTTVSGLVKDNAGKPLDGATVTEKNGKASTTTNAEGRFTLSIASSNGVLVISFVGMQSQDFPVSGRSNLEISMSAASSENLDDVVVIGYGAVKRRDLTGSVYSIKNADLVRSTTFNPLEAMQGRVPGVDITRTSGSAGAGVNIRVRGNRTINGSNEPLYIIDGFQGGNPADLNPNDIESIEVLKDASATAIYGAQGANGVFIITTKKGSSGKVKINYDGYYGVNTYANYPGRNMRDNYIQFRREAYRTVGEWNSPADDQNLFTAAEWDAIQRDEWVDWFDEIARDGQQQSHTLSVQGGSEKSKIFLSGNYFKEAGMFRADEFTRYNVRLNAEQTLASWAKVGLNSQLTFVEHDRRTDPMALVNQTSPIAKPYNDDGSINLFPVYGENSILSPLADERGDSVYKNNLLRTNVLVNGFLELKPAKGLTFRSTFGANIDFARVGIFQSATSVSQRLTRQVVSQQSTSYNRLLNFDNVLSYQTNIADKHDLTFTAIQSYIQSDFDGLNATGNNQLLNSQTFYNLSATNPTNRNIGSSFEGSNNLAFAGRINYAFLNKYLLTLTYRADGASRLSSGPGKWAYFPSVAAGWKISEENFLSGVTWLNNLKIRGSYGETGNYGIAVYGTQSTINPFSNMAFGENQAQYYYFNQFLGNKGLQWERSATANIGVDFGLLKNRINGSIDLYSTTTTGLLYARQLPRSSGSVSNGVMFSIYENIGETSNKGVELALNAAVIQKRNFQWNTTLTFTSNKEKLEKVISDQNILNGTAPETQSLLIGYPINSFYSYKKLGIWQTSEAEKAAQVKFGSSSFKPGDLKIEDINGDNIIDPENDRQYLGSTVPKFVLGWQNNFSYKGFDLDIYTFMRQGQTINASFLTRYNPSGNGNTISDFNYWTPENPTNDFPRPVKGGQFINYFGYQGFAFVDGSFIKIRNITLGYNLPERTLSKIKAQRVRLYVTANNYFTFSNNHMLKNYDPERGGDEGSPLTRQLVFGLNVGF
jgi:TonB-linked SusC/RagA family outer membrane protein